VVVCLGKDWEMGGKKRQHAPWGARGGRGRSCARITQRRILKKKQLIEEKEREGKKGANGRGRRGLILADVSSEPGKKKGLRKKGGVKITSSIKRQKRKKRDYVASDLPCRAFKGGGRASKGGGKKSGKTETTWWKEKKRTGR